MQAIKEFFLILDITFGAIWGFTIIDLSTSVVGGGFVFSAIDNFIKVLFAFAGLIFFLMRMHHFFHKSRIERAKMREELEILEKENNK